MKFTNFELGRSDSPRSIIVACAFILALAIIVCLIIASLGTGRIIPTNSGADVAVKDQQITVVIDGLEGSIGK